ncbi:MAG: DUF177 domain-containing protein [Candidatus Eremiobacteraeota bacterium]|nr:DUF177 domain-containing protein [Candidatus Eremiobacteraeota bacterium]
MHRHLQVVAKGKSILKKGSPLGTSVSVMSSSNLLEVGGILAGGRQLLAIDESVRLEPFEGVSFHSPAQIALTIARADRGLSVTGFIEVQARGECDRCLVEVRVPIRLEVNEIVERVPGSKDDPFAESNVLVGDRLDIADLARQLVCSAVPLRILCKEGCQGLCRICGANLNDEKCGCTGEI